MYVGRVDPKKIAAPDRRQAAKEANYPGLNRVTQVRVPAGLDVEARHRARGDAGAPALPVPVDPVHPDREYGLDKQVFKNWDPFVNRPMTLSEALATSCDTYFYDVGYRFYNGGRQGRTASRSGRGSSASGARRDRHRRRGRRLVPTPAWRKRTFTSDWDKAWNPGDSIQLAIGQKDVTVTPLQMARFYAMIANGGKLVTPYVVSEVETPARDGQTPVVLRRFAPDPPARRGRPGRAPGGPRRPLLGDPLAYGTSSGVFGSFPVSIAGKTGTAEKVVPIPGYPAEHLEDQSWWCGYGPAETDVARIVVCAVIENGGHGSTAAAPAALRVFEKFFGVKGGYQAW